jgi:hypothetical protein
MSISAMTTQMGQYVSIGISYEKCTPLSRGPLYGLLYSSVGIGLGFLAHAVGGWVSVPPLAALGAAIYSRGMDGPIYGVLAGDDPTG